MLTLPEPSTISRVTEGRGAAVKRLTVHGNSRANGASKAGLPVKRESGQEVVCRLSGSKDPLLFDIVNERKRSAGGCVLAALVGNNEGKQKHSLMRFKRVNKSFDRNIECT